MQDTLQSVVKDISFKAGVHFAIVVLLLQFFVLEGQSEIGEYELLKSTMYDMHRTTRNGKYRSLTEEESDMKILYKVE